MSVANRVAERRLGQSARSASAVLSLPTSMVCRQSKSEYNPPVPCFAAAPVCHRIPTMNRRLRCAHACIALCALAACALPTAAAEVALAKSPANDGGPTVAQAATPGTRESLFNDDKPAPASPAQPESRESLLGTEGKPAVTPTPAKSPWSGFVRGELAYTYPSPAHWSKMLVRSEIDARGALFADVRYKIGARVDYDFVYDATNFYPSDVRRDQRVNFLLRENYLDFGVGNWDLRIGRQHIVWGEMVGLFFADVVSAKDLREFVLPDFDILRIPQWATRAEYFENDIHAEAIWIPIPSYDEIGKPGAEFFPAVVPPPPGFATLYDNEQIPERRLAHTNYGLRLSMLRNGWDVSGFYYGGMDAQPTFYRQTVLAPEAAFIYQARHDRIDQLGGTLAKDFGPAVFKAEGVYTHGRSYSVLRPDNDGVVAQNTLDVIGGLDFSFENDVRLNMQVYDRVFFNHDPDIIYDRNETGFSVLLNRKFGERLEGELLFISSVNRTDWMARPRLTWRFQRDWAVIVGADIFDGPPLGLFGQYANRDRVYTELRYSF
jgi:hypothetical protein